MHRPVPRRRPCCPKIRTCTIVRDRTRTPRAAQSSYAGTSPDRAWHTPAEHLISSPSALVTVREPQRETRVPVKLSNVPLEAVVLGAGHVIEHYEALKGMFMGARR